MIERIKTDFAKLDMVEKAVVFLLFPLGISAWMFTGVLISTGLAFLWKALV